MKAWMSKIVSSTENSLPNVFNIKRVFTDHRACLEQTQPDFVILCPATAEHGDWTEKVAPYGVDMLVEKPFAASLAEADRMVAAVEATGRRLAINWPMRWYPSHVTAHRLLNEGLIGKLAEVHYYDGNRGPMYHLADKVEVNPTQEDEAIAHGLAKDLGVDIKAYAEEMFAAKSDVSAFSDAELLRMDSKEYEVDGTKLRVSVLETTTPAQILDRKESLKASMKTVAAEDGADEVLLFVVDILKEEATLIVPNERVKGIAEASFATTVEGDTLLLPGVMSRKKQIMPVLKAA